MSADPSPRPDDPRITPEMVAEHGLSPDEYEQILDIMGRPPTFTELGVFSAMWSEHCGYKNSKRLLRLLPTRAPWVIQGPGENAGVIDVGGDHALAFKIESHNHPSAVEPYQGAATGIGGILRDVFTMGARPVATLNSLHFGDLDDVRVRYLFSGVVKGVGDYGNCVGIPSIGGEVYFDRGYRDNPIVNAMCLGLLHKGDLMRGLAQGVGNTLMAVGARTGRDGIHGATFASDELSEGADVASRPQVQVGDPFTEKLLLEASLELISSGHIVGIQDMGAAGLTSSGAEMAGRSGTGIELDVARVPVREEGMTPYEILLSESQERMLVVARRGREDGVRKILEKWELDAATIGEVTSSGTFRVLEQGVPVADIPALPLTEGCPTYERPAVEAPEARERRRADLSPYLEPPDGLERAFLAIVGSPNIASKQWVYEQYDTTVRANSIETPGGSAGVVRIPGTDRGVVASTDCNGRHTYLNPRTGAQGAVVEGARNVACTGATPMAITNCLNFGSPLKAEIRHQFREAVLGLRDACAHLEIPVTGGNVSFYNETDGHAVYPTPVVGMVGVIEDLATLVRHSFQAEGDAIYLLGTNRGELGGSEYLYALHGVVAGEPPGVDLVLERQLLRCMARLTGRGLLRSAHDVSSGGLAATLVESCLGHPRSRGEIGATVLLADEMGASTLLFGEDHGRIVVSASRSDEEELRRVCSAFQIPAARIGTVGGESLSIQHRGSRYGFELGLLREHYFGTIPRAMDDEAWGAGTA